MIHCMLDLETLGTTAGSIILSIGAVKFVAKVDQEGEPYEELARCYFTVDLNESMALGFIADPETLKWWLLQDGAAKDALFVDPWPVVDALKAFRHWFLAEGHPVEEVWSNGATMDLVVLGAYYNALGVRCPWSYKMERCHRTMRELFGRDREPPKVGTAHNALDDAEFQARHLAFILQALQQNRPFA